MTDEEHYTTLKTMDPDPANGEPQGYIQWKGSDVCLDLHCSCGTHDHIDAEFAHYWRCSGCGRVYALSPQIRVLPLEGEHAAFVEREYAGLIKTI